MTNKRAREENRLGVPLSFLGCSTAKYRDPSPFDFAQGQDDDVKILRSG
jgi:hypothetical protein